MPLTIILKSALILGFLSSKFGDVGGGLSHYRRALGLIEEGNRVWPNVDFQDKGTMFSNTFIRASKILLCRESLRHPALSMYFELALHYFFALLTSSRLRRVYRGRSLQGQAVDDQGWILQARGD